VAGGDAALGDRDLDQGAGGGDDPDDDLLVAGVVGVDDQLPLAFGELDREGAGERVGGHRGLAAGGRDGGRERPPVARAVDDGAGDRVERDRVQRAVEDGGRVGGDRRRAGGGGVAELRDGDLVIAFDGPRQGVRAVGTGGDGAAGLLAVEDERGALDRLALGVGDGALDGSGRADRPVQDRFERVEAAVAVDVVQFLGAAAPLVGGRVRRRGQGRVDGLVVADEFGCGRQHEGDGARHVRGGHRGAVGDPVAVGEVGGADGHAGGGEVWFDLAVQAGAAGGEVGGDALGVVRADGDDVGVQAGRAAALAAEFAVVADREDRDDPGGVPQGHHVLVDRVVDRE